MPLLQQTTTTISHNKRIRKETGIQQEHFTNRTWPWLTILKGLVNGQPETKTIVGCRI